MYVRPLRLLGDIFREKRRGNGKNFKRFLLFRRCALPRGGRASSGGRRGHIRRLRLRRKAAFGALLFPRVPRGTGILRGISGKAKKIPARFPLVSRRGRFLSARSRFVFSFYLFSSIFISKRIIHEIICIIWEKTFTFFWIVYHFLHCDIT